jgi:ribosomal protein L31E
MRTVVWTVSPPLSTKTPVLADFLPLTFVVLQMVDKKKSKSKEAVTREYTIHLGKRLHDTSFKKRAPLAIKEIKKFAKAKMNTNDVRLDVKLNKAVWSRVCGLGTYPRQACLIKYSLYCYPFKKIFCTL